MLLERHDFYVREVEQRVLSQFADIEGEAKQLIAREEARLASLPHHPDADPSDIPERAYQAGIDHYALLSELRRQTVLGSLAGLYHQWDKDLRDFIEAEVRRYLDHKGVAALWRMPTTDLLDEFKPLGWDCSGLSFYPDLAAFGLVVNVYKHGKGRSLDTLAQRHPEFFGDHLKAAKGRPWAKVVDHDWLEVTPPQFDALAGSLRSFWDAMPERIGLTRAAP